MTIISERPGDAPPVATAVPIGASQIPEGVIDANADQERPIRAGFVLVASGLAGVSVAWMAGGLFESPYFARACGLGGVLVASGLLAVSLRMGRRAFAQYAVLPIAAVLGAALVAPSATGGASLPGLIGAALTGAGLRQAPSPFYPGWRFVLLILAAVVTAAGFTNAVRFRKPKLATLVPLPITVAAGLLQPHGDEVVSSMVAIFFVVASIAVSYGADLPADASVGAFELRRLARGGLLLVALMVAMALLAQTNFLFPQTNQSHIIPPRKPPQVPLQKDQPLFLAQTANPALEVGPWQVGTLDVYQQGGWLLPPYDPASFVNARRGAFPVTAPASTTTFSVHMTVYHLNMRTLPTPANPEKISGTDLPVQLDPRTDVPWLQENIPHGFTYTLLAPVFPTAAQLDSSPAPPAAIEREFTALPPPPAAVRALLAGAPSKPFERLQYVRNALYKSVIAAGIGEPVDISPGRVAQMLRPNTMATPYEIVAAEAMLARWAGIPARIGFGYYGGVPTGNGLVVHPRDGAAWLEAYFNGYGWVPLIGVPPRALAGSSANQKQNSQVLAVTTLQLTVYLPTKVTSLLALYQILAYWFTHAVLPLLLGFAFLYLAWAPACKARRTSKRWRWAHDYGPIGAIMVTYAAFRDRCYDLNLGEVRATPLEFAHQFAPDDEFDELAWLVTRAYWGDLRRNADFGDAAEAEQLAASVLKRIEATQPVTNKALGWFSRASLRDPYTEQVPNFWPQAHLRRRVRAAWAKRPKLAVARHWRRPIAAPATAVVALLAVVFLGGCAAAPTVSSATPLVAYPSVLLPADLLGYQLLRVPAAEQIYHDAQYQPGLLVSDGKVWTIHQGTIIQGSIQISLFKPNYDSQKPTVQTAIEDQIGANYTPIRFGPVLIQLTQTSTERIFIWFPPQRDVMEIFVARTQWAQALQFVRAAIAYQLNLPAQYLAGGSLLPNYAQSDIGAPVVGGSSSGSGSFDPQAPEPPGTGSASSQPSPAPKSHPSAHPSSTKK